MLSVEVNDTLRTEKSSHELNISGGSKRGARSPTPLFWVKNEEITGNPVGQGKQNSTNPPPPPPHP